MSPSSRPVPRKLGWTYRWMMGLVGYFERWLLMSCRTFTRLASEKHERPLTRFERTRQRLHRLVCEVCRTQERRLERLRDLVREIAADTDEFATVRLTESAARAIRDAMAAEARRRGETSGRGEE